MTLGDPLPSAQPPSSDLPPLPMAYPSQPPEPKQPDQTAVAAERAARLQELTSSVERGGHWFYWIAGLSLVNLFMMMTKAGSYFVIGLALPIIAGALTGRTGGTIQAAAVIVSVAAAAMFAAFGYFATRRALWAFIVGMVLYAIDGGIFLWFQDWMSVAFHAFALICLLAGAKSCAQFGKLTAQTTAPV